MLAENDASRACRDLYAAFHDRNWDRFEALLAENFIVDDRRKLIGGVSTGRKGFVATWKTIAEQGYDTIEVTDIATRGKTLALQSFVAYGTHGFTAEALAVTQTSEGRMSFVVVFDLDELAAASAELDARFVAFEQRA